MLEAMNVPHSCLNAATIFGAASAEWLPVVEHFGNILIRWNMRRRRCLRKLLGEVEFHLVGFFLPADLPGNIDCDKRNGQQHRDADADRNYNCPVHSVYLRVSLFQRSVMGLPHLQGTVNSCFAMLVLPLAWNSQQLHWNSYGARPRSSEIVAPQRQPMDICATWRYVPNSLPQQGQHRRSRPRAPGSGGRLLFLMVGSFLGLKPNHFPEQQLVVVLRFSHKVDVLPEQLAVMLLPAGFAQQGTDSHAHGQQRNVDEDLIRHCHHPALSR
nr:MAG TPA: hypothetical protein [Caudoviricetes sp.]